MLWAIFFIMTFLRKYWMNLWVAIWCFFIVGALLIPLIIPNHPMVAFLMNLFYKPTCHQIPNRCFSIAGNSMSICTRCTGIYIGMIVGGIIYRYIAISLKNWLRKRPNGLILPILLALPLFVDGTLAKIAIHDSSNIFRLLTGILFGLAVVSLIFPDIEKAFGEQRLDSDKIANGGTDV